MLKLLLFNHMCEMNFDRGNMHTLLEKVENVRLLFYRDVKHSHNTLFFDNRENYPIVKAKLSKNRMLLECIGENNLDGFIKFMDNFLVGYRDYPNIKKILVTKNFPNRDFFSRLELEIDHIIPSDIFRRETLLLDIRHQINKM